MKKGNPDRDRSREGKRGIRHFIPLIFSGLFGTHHRAVKIDFDTDRDAILNAEIADRRNREKFPNRRNRMKAKAKEK